MTVAEMKESLEILTWFPSLTAEGPPPLSGARQLKAMAKLDKDIAEIEKQRLAVSDIEGGKLIPRLQRKMQGKRVLRECGVTPTQYKNLRKRYKGDRRKAMVLGLQKQYYAKSGMIGDDWPARAYASLESTLPTEPGVSSSVQPAVPDALARPPPVSAPRSMGLGSSHVPAFVGDMITTQADGTILGHAGSTSVLSTVVLDGAAPSTPPKEEDGLEVAAEQRRVAAQKLLVNAIERADARSGASFVPLQVEYRERYHASGKIPGNRRRKDNTGALSDKEVLAARVVGWTVRPWLMMGLASPSSCGALPENIVVNCEVQSYDPRPSADASLNRTHADPTALAINSAIAALYQSSYSNPHPNLPVPAEAAACVKLAVMRDGAVVFDPTPGELGECQFELLYAGTKDRTLMLEFSANAGQTLGSAEHLQDPGIAEGSVVSTLRLAHEAILPIIEKQEDLRETYTQEVELMAQEKDEGLMTDEEVAQLLGLDSFGAASTVSEGPFADVDGMAIVDEANAFVWSRLEDVAMKLFGCSGGQSKSLASYDSARIHEGSLLSKKVRGRRENVLQAEISRLLREEFMPNDERLAGVYRAAIREGEGSECLVKLSHHVHECTMKRAMAECAARKRRADGRPGLNVVRPISATAPIFPDSVHGSALFSRGETQVLCTATMGAPREGLPIADPYSFEGQGKEEIQGDDENVSPIGSLRFLRTQAEMEADMNTRRVKAGRELMGDSGVLSEVKRAFLHYDFPDFSTGVVKSRAGASANRRAIGHGNLAEKAVLPALPHIDDFPYTIRLTSEVTSSNGSSSMASACGVSLALLDAGVPMIAPVAGVSVGLAPGSNELLLDITGTEDHYGDMDFKICGTHGGITAMQLDVKQPLPLENLLAALDLAKEGRRAILNAMENECRSTLPGLHPRPSLKSTAPRVEVIAFDPNRKRDLVGPGGAVLRQLEDRFDISLDLSQEGRCIIFGSPDERRKGQASHHGSCVRRRSRRCLRGHSDRDKRISVLSLSCCETKKDCCMLLTDDAAGKHPGGNLGLVKSHLKVGDKIEVLCTKIDHVQGSIKLSRKKLLRNRTQVPISKNRDVANGSINGVASSYAPKVAIDEASHVDNDEQEGGGDAEEEDEDFFDEWIETNSEDVYDDESDETGYSSDESDDVAGGGGDDANDVDDSDFIELDDAGSDERVSEAAPDHVSALGARWMERFNELEDFKKQNGHCNVPRTSGPLGGWVKTQRRAHKEGKMRDDRKQRLEAIGFEWTVGVGTTSSYSTLQNDLWDQRYQELIDFKREHGHCNVPRSSGKLGTWGEAFWKTEKNVSRQSGSSGQLGWVPPAQGSKNDLWEQRYQELIDFKREHGHCMVPARAGSLGKWVGRQRHGPQRGSILEDRKERLEAIGFAWSGLASTTGAGGDNDDDESLKATSLTGSSEL
ncbi:LOW QUALITY PROTEIN: hypothetical protein ACHAXT_011134 [Thalassiosira profunda]